jgi:hypothetical protein
MMRIASVTLSVAAPALMAPAIAAAPAAKPALPGLCRAGEVPIFSCRLGRKSVAICGVTSPSGARSAEYRFGAPGKLEMTYPGPEGGKLGYASVPYSGGGEEQASFERGGYRYVVYSSMVRTGFGADGLNNPAFESGLIVQQGGKTVSKSKCVDHSDATLSEQDARRFGVGDGTFVERP